MATGNSGSFTLAGSANFSVVVYWSETYDEAANTHTISVDSVKLKSANYYGFTYYPTGSVTVDGEEVVAFSSAKGSHSCTVSTTNTEYAIRAEGSFPAAPWVSGAITGNADGTKSVSIAVKMTCYTAAGNGGSGWKVDSSSTVTLRTIPRASSVSMSAATMGSSTTITVSRASTAFTHTLTYSFGSASGTIATKSTSASINWTPPLSLAYQVPNSTYGTVTITCQTYNGNTLIGTTSATATLYVPTTVVPSIGTFTATRVDGTVPSTWGIYVQTKSKATLTISGAAGSYGSTITAYSISGGGFSGTGNSLTTGFLNTYGTIYFYARVKDSRGRWSSEMSVSIYVYSYASPYFTSYLSQRCNSAGTVASDGTYVRGQVYFGYYGCNGYNSVTRATYYRKSGATTWTSASKSFNSGTAFTFGNGNISVESTYEIRYTLTDAFTTVSIIDTVSTAAVVMDFKSGGKGIAVGKVSETDYAFEVSEDWNVYVYGMLLSAYIRNSVNQIWYGTCSTTTATAEKYVYCSGFTLKTGAAILVNFTYSNTATAPTLNVNGTGAYTMTAYSSSAPPTYYWRAGQPVLFVFSGSYWIAVIPPSATTTYYGVTKLSSSVSSTSTTMAATASAVKSAYDRNSWTSISLTNALAIAYGGTGATTAAAARTNLGISVTSLYDGTLTTGSITFDYGGYNFYIIVATPMATSSRACLVVPAAVITTTAVAYQVADETNYMSMNLSYSGTTVTLAIKQRSSTGQVYRVFGVN